MPGPQRRPPTRHGVRHGTRWQGAQRGPRRSLHRTRNHVTHRVGHGGAATPARAVSGDQRRGAHGAHARLVPARAVTPGRLDDMVEGELHTALTRTPGELTEMRSVSAAWAELALTWAGRGGEAARARSAEKPGASLAPRCPQTLLSPLRD